MLLGVLWACRASYSHENNSFLTCTKQSFPATSLSARRSKPWSLPSLLALPKSTDPAFIGQIINFQLARWVVIEKTANKRGGTSTIWQHGAELREFDKPPARKPHWLCKLCWDNGKKFIKGTSTTTVIKLHLADIHRLNSDGPILTEEDTPISIDEEGIPAPPAPFLRALISKTKLDKFKLALIMWICVAYIALSCVEVPL